MENYDIERRSIGAGQYGSVFRATNRRTGQVVAIKKTLIQQKKDGIPSSTIREVAILKNFMQHFPHPNIVQLFDAFYEMESFYLVLELMDTSLSSYFVENPLLTRAQYMPIMQKILRGVSHCHANSIIHRDLKPHNILLNRNGDVKLADFGLARSFAVPTEKFTKEAVSPWYRAPDVFLGNPHYTSSIDVWSCAVIFTEFFEFHIFATKDAGTMLSVIYRTFGTPAIQDLPFIANIPGYEHPHVVYPPQPLTDIFPSQLSQEADLVDLLMRMFVYNPDVRITAEQALQHPFFQS